MSSPRLGVLTSHPIQYQAPLFGALARQAELEVFFAHRATPEQQAEAGFGVRFDWDVDLLAGYSNRFLHNRAAHPGVEHFRAASTPEIGDLIARERFDAFLVMGWHLQAYWQAIRACHQQGVPVMVRGESQRATPRGPLKRLAKQLVHRWIVRQFDALLCIGSRNRAYLMHYGAAPERLFFSPYAVDNEWFGTRSALAGPALAGLRMRLGIAPGERVVLFAGKLVAKKRPVDLVLAAGLLARQGSPVRLLLVGSGPLRETVLQVAAEQGVRVDLVGFQNQTELPQWYALADLLVLPSDGGETWGLVVNEAMASGTPAVVSDGVGCGPDLIDPDATGAIHPLGNVAGLAAAIARMMHRKHDPDVRAALAAKMSRYSIATAVEGILEAVDAVRRPSAGVGHAVPASLPPAARPPGHGVRHRR
jgi:glycosyltransferase involved in cell wall biosynthesis